MTIKDKPVFIITAQKRAVRKPEGATRKGDGSLADWLKDDEGFERRWGKRTPDLGVQRSIDARELCRRANDLNEAQIRSGFLDWLYVVDIDAPVHSCTKACPTGAGS